MDFTAPKAGRHNFKLYLMSDSYIGCDQEFTIALDVGEGKVVESASEGDGSDSDA